ncbi:MAG: hypothetical protein J6B06_02995 [Lachnospiraceae bacterium]|nr:hypothetical protein [Lachnospiraceae bacterium]
MKPVYKGQLEYIKKKKIQRAIICLISYLIIAAIFLTGYLTTGSRENILTLMAILGSLPAAKFTVSFFMLLPYRSQTREVYEEVQRLSGEAILYTDILISTEKKILPTDFVVIRDGNLCGYASHPKYDTAYAQDYLAGMYKRNGLKPNIKIFTDKNKFLKRVGELAAMPTDEKQAAKDTRTAELLLTLIL